MPYTTLLEQLSALHDSELNKLQAVELSYRRQSFSDKDELLSKLNNSPIRCGWITSADQVQRLDNAEQLDFENAPLQAELLLDASDSCHHSVRIAYREQQWHWVDIRLDWHPETPNALAETIALASREKAQAAHCYARIWQQREPMGIISTDAIFIGFNEGRP